MTDINVRTTDPDTSHEAADAINKKLGVRNLVRFLTANDREDGWTTSELRNSAGVGVHYLSMTQRVSDALKADLIVTIGKRPSTETSRNERAYRAK